MQGATKKITRKWGSRAYFNPRSLCRERRFNECITVKEKHFNPRSLCRERRYRRETSSGNAHFNPRSLCRERRISTPNPIRFDEISIHAPYAGSDSLYSFTTYGKIISIHAPYAGSDAVNHYFTFIIFKFQSTLPMQGAWIEI